MSLLLSCFFSLFFILSLLLSCFFCLFSLLFSSLLFSSLLFSSLLFSSLLFSSLLSSSLLFSSLAFLSCLSFSVSLLSVSVSLCLSLSLSPCGVVWCGVCRCGRGVVGGRGVCLCVCVCVCVRCGTLKNVKNPCVRSKRLRVYIQNVPVFAGTTRTCVSTCARGAGAHGDVLRRFERTHGDVLNGPTGGREGVIVSSAYQNSPTYGHHVLQRFTKETNGSYPFSV